MYRILNFLVPVVLSLTGGCDNRQKVMPDELEPDYQLSLPMRNSPFDILIADADADGLRDVSVISHGEGYGQTFFQVKPRQFVVGAQQNSVGFHPGNLLQWPGVGAPMVLSAEGTNQIMALQPDEKGQWQPLSSLPETLPGRSTLFEWEGWGKSLAVAPFKNGYLTLLKGYDPRRGMTTERVQIDLSEDPARSVRRAERVTVADVDADGIDELLVASPITRQVFVIRKPQDAKQKPKAEVLLEDPLWGTPNQVVCWDVNGDSQPDLLIPEQTGQGRILVYLGQGKGTFGKTPLQLRFGAGKGVRQLTAGRDRDGRNFLLGSGEGVLTLYDLSATATLEGEFTVYPAYSVTSKIPEVSPKIELTDVDGDGWLDAVIGRVMAAPERGNVWLAFGPLWDHFGEMERRQFVLK